MKKMLFLSLVAIGAVLSSSAQNYPNYPQQGNSSYPQNGGYQQPAADQYYYYPDANVYYYPYTSNYIYYDQNRWCQAAYLPEYMRFNNSAPRVVINYLGRSIWDLNNDHMRQYRNDNNHNYNNGYYNNGGYYNNAYETHAPRKTDMHYDDRRSRSMGHSDNRRIYSRH